MWAEDEMLQGHGFTGSVRVPANSDDLLLDWDSWGQPVRHAIDHLREGLREFGEPEATVKSPRTLSGGSRRRGRHALGTGFSLLDSRTPSLMYR